MLMSTILWRRCPFFWFEKKFFDSFKLFSSWFNDWILHLFWLFFQLKETWWWSEMFFWAFYFNFWMWKAAYPCYDSLLDSAYVKYYTTQIIFYRIWKMRNCTISLKRLSRKEKRFHTIHPPKLLHRGIVNSNYPRNITLIIQLIKNLGGLCKILPVFRLILTFRIWLGN